MIVWPYLVVPFGSARVIDLRDGSTVAPNMLHQGPSAADDDVAATAQPQAPGGGDGGPPPSWLLPTAPAPADTVELPERPPRVSALRARELDGWRNRRGRILGGA
jgi:hypothetical protein